MNTLKNKYTIKIHSFIDIITNLSTEIYVAANQKTVESVKEIINGILKVGDSKYTCDDLFTVEIDLEDFKNNDYGDSGKSYEEWVKDHDYDDYRSIRLLVKCKDTTNPVGATTAKLLSSLTSLFNIEANYNG